MRLPLIILLAASAAAWTIPASAQTDDSILVTGKRLKSEKPVPMSDWRVAETQNVLVFARDGDERLTRIAHNLEKLHFLLSVLLNKVDSPEDPIKLRVTLFGDRADFNHLDLKNLRWQWGPYPSEFPSELYYDPREDGAVAASAASAQKILLRPAYYRPSNPNCDDKAPDNAMSGASAPQPDSAFGFDFGSLVTGEVSVCQSSEGRLYALYAQHYLLTYFPAAYPRWYLQGFGEIFSTFKADQAGHMEYGRAPDGLRKVLEWYGRYPVRKVLDGDYLTAEWPTEWTPYHAWALTHLLFFSDEWKAPLHNYLAAFARGAGPQEAGKSFGNIDRLQREVAGYRGRKIPYETMNYPPERVGEPIVRRLTRSEAAYVRGQLELGARVEVASDEDRRERAQWLERLRDNAARYPAELEAQLLLAEAECRSGNQGECLAAADRALALAPTSSTALAWKGIALVRQAVAGPAPQRQADLKAGRALIIRANRSNPEAVLPLIAYYRSFEEAGEPAPDVAVDGMIKVVERAPFSPASRLALGEAYAAHDLPANARRMLLPVAQGAYSSPEQPEAQAILKEIEKSAASSGAGTP